MNDLWMYQCKLVRIIDGDTVDVAIDMGLRIYRHERIRILGIDTPEMHGTTRDAGIAARNFVINWWIQPPDREWTHRIRTTKSDVFGRWLGTIWSIETGESLADALLKAGHAVIFRGIRA